MLSYVEIVNAQGGVERLHAETGARIVRKAEGLVGLPAPRSRSRLKSKRHGSVISGRGLGPGLVTFEGEVWAAGQRAVYDEWERLVAAFYDTSEAPQLLRWCVGDPATDGLHLQQWVRLAAEVEPPIEGGANLFTYQVHFEVEDPRAYSQQRVVTRSAPLGDTGGGSTFPATFPDTFTLGAGGLAGFENRGKLPTPPDVFVHGAVVNPRVRLHDGRELAFNASIGAGDYLVLDAANRAVLLNGVAPRSNWLDFAVSRWFDLPRGPGTVRLLADSGDANAYMTVEFRHAHS